MEEYCQDVDTTLKRVQRCTCAVNNWCTLQCSKKFSSDAGVEIKEFDATAVRRISELHSQVRPDSSHYGSMNKEGPTDSGKNQDNWVALPSSGTSRTHKTTFIQDVKGELTSFLENYDLKAKEAFEKFTEECKGLAEADIYAEKTDIKDS